MFSTLNKLVSSVEANWSRKIAPKSRGCAIRVKNAFIYLPFSLADDALSKIESLQARETFARLSRIFQFREDTKWEIERKLAAERDVKGRGRKMYDLKTWNHSRRCVIAQLWLWSSPVWFVCIFVRKLLLDTNERPISSSSGATVPPLQLPYQLVVDKTTFATTIFYSNAILHNFGDEYVIPG